MHSEKVFQRARKASNLGPLSVTFFFQVLKCNTNQEYNSESREADKNFHWLHGRLIRHFDQHVLAWQYNYG